MKKLIFLIMATALLTISNAWSDNTSKTYYQMGMEALQQEKYDQALQYMLKEYKKNQVNGYACAWIAQLTQDSFKNWNADQWANAALMLLPKTDNKTRSDMYVVLAKKENEKEAEEKANVYFETAIKLDSNNINAYQEKFLQIEEQEETVGKYSRKNYLKMTENICNKILRIDKNNLWVYYTLASTYEQQYSMDNDFWDRKPTKAELEKCKREKEVAIKNYNILIEKIKENKKPESRIKGNRFYNSNNSISDGALVILGTALDLYQNATEHAINMVENGCKKNSDSDIIELSDTYYWCQADLGNISFLFTQNIDERANQLKQAINNATKTNCKLSLMNLLNEAYEENGKYEECLKSSREYYHELKNTKEINDSSKIENLYSTTLRMENCYYELGYYRKALLCENMMQNDFINTAIDNIGDTDADIISKAISNLNKLDFKEASSDSTFTDDTWSRTLRILTDWGKYDEVLNLINVTLKKETNKSDYYTSHLCTKAEILVAKGEISKALILLNSIKVKKIEDDELDDESGDGLKKIDELKQKGNLYMILGKYPNAIACYRACTDYSFGYYGYIALAYKRLGNNALAIKNAKKLMSDYGDIEENPFFSKPRAYQAIILGRKKKAENISEELSQYSMFKDFSLDAIRDYDAISGNTLSLREIYYTRACINALAGNKTMALAYLKKTLDAGFNNKWRMTHDPDLKSLRNDPEYKQMISEHFNNTNNK